MFSFIDGIKISKELNCNSDSCNDIKVNCIVIGKWRVFIIFVIKFVF